MFSNSKKSVREAREKQSGKKQKQRHQTRLFAGLAAGVVGGIVATWALDKYQQGAVEATRRAEAAVNADPVLSRQQEDQLHEQQRVHAEAAHRIAKSTVGRKLSRAQQRNAAAVIHYAAGALAGGIYGLTAEILPGVRRWYGMGYSKFIFLGASEPLLPWLGIGPKRQAQVTPASLPAPLVFGAALETTRRFLRRLL
jgi:uncharacterized membrane protein YagU involved in acid resistance